MTSVAVLVPWRSKGCPHREAAWERVHAEWAKTGWPIIAADDGAAPFSRAASLNLAADEYPTADVFVIADADTLIDGDQARAAVELAAAAPGMVLAYTDYCYLSPKGTTKILAGYRGDWRPFVLWGLNNTVSSCVAVSRGTWDAVHGFDPRCRAWGHEDNMFFLACETLAGPTRRVPGPAWHLYHPTEPERPRYNRILLDWYHQAYGDPDAMHTLIAQREQVGAA